MNLLKLDSLAKSISLPKPSNLPKMGGAPSVPLPPFLDKLAAEFRQRKLLPLVLALVLALIAVPVLLSSNPTPPAPSAAALAAAARPAEAAVPVLNVAGGSAPNSVSGPARNPFSPQSTGRPHAAAGSAATAGASAFLSATHAPSTSFSGGTSGGAASSSGSGNSPAPSAAVQSPPAAGSFSAPAPVSAPLPAPVVAARPRPSFTALAADQAYRVALALTNPSGGVQTTDPLERLSPIPNAQHPLLVELGVLQGGRRVLFALQPNVLVSGPGACIPGPRDCEILSLAAGQVEELGVRWGSGAVPLYMFSVTGLAPQTFPSSEAASSARQARSSAGAAILRADKLPALSLFRFQTGIGALADLRNLAFGG